MKVIDILEAGQNLSELVDEAAEGKSFIIAVDGKSMVRVDALTADVLATLRPPFTHAVSEEEAK